MLQQALQAATRDHLPGEPEALHTMLELDLWLSRQPVLWGWVMDAIEDGVDSYNATSMSRVISQARKAAGGLPETFNRTIRRCSGRS